MAENQNDQNIAYCVKCGEKKGMASPREEEMESKSGKRRVMKGECPDCGTKMTRFLPSKKD